MSDITNNVHVPKAHAPLYVYEAPVRIWHWVHAFSIVVLAITGWLIANPGASVGGEASDSYIMGNLRYLHLIAAHVFTVGFLVRIYWALVGNRWSRELFVVPVWSKKWWSNLWYEVRHYTFTTREVRREAGHNPLAQVAMWIFNVALVLVFIGTGYALHGEALGAGSWADVMFGWVNPLLGNSQEVRMWHYTAMWFMIAFAIIHMYMAVRADIMGRQSSVSAMISGWRTYRDDKP